MLEHIEKSEFNSFNSQYQMASLLTKREKECLLYILKGLTAKHIAKYMGVSYRTVETHIQNIKTKLCVQRRVDIIIKAFELNNQKIETLND